MKAYTDNRFTVAEDTLLMYSGKEASLLMPSVLGGIQIKRIGASAFSESRLSRLILPEGLIELRHHSLGHCPSLKTVSLPSTLRRLDNNVFFASTKLTTVRLASLRLSKDGFKALTDNSMRLKNGNRLTVMLPDNDVLRRLTEGNDLIELATFIPDNFSRLFLKPDSDKIKTDPDYLFPILGDKEDDDVLSEREGVRRTILSGEKTYYHNPTETENDLLIKNEKSVVPTITAVLIFGEEKELAETGEISVPAELRIGQFFWQSLVPITYEGELYYIYRRCYPTRDKKLRYFIEDVAVFDSGAKLLPAQGKAEAVYGKYALTRVL